jgi:5-keto 4-deoxyuronate isomerase
VNPELMESLEKLAAAGIQIVPAEITSHFILERDGFVAFVERREQGFGNIGAPGLMTEHGYAALIWRGDQALFVGKGFQQAASPEQVEKIRAFASDLAAALQ